MNTDLETQLSADMDRFTLGIRVPPDLARKACRRNRRRRARLRAAIASGTTAALIVAVAVAGVAGVFTSTARLPIQTTAYVVKQVDKALAPANVATLIRVTRAVPVPGHKPGEFVSPSALLGPTCTGSTTLSWTYGEIWKLSAYDADGRHLFDLRTSATKSSVQESEVIYCNRTWWAGTKPRAYSGGGSGIDSPAQIRSALSAGIYRVAGSQLVDGVKTIKLTEGPTLPSLTLWVSPVTYLPVRIISGPLQVDFQWLPPTPANLARLGLPVPAGFKQVPPNL
jgi:hypothetical protein